ncbi:MAG: DUF4249 domain-containing protein [Bacteroidales bacterium]|nr:DUF4249 domain-containing protein [Bacteroidales bacterium]
MRVSKIRRNWLVLAVLLTGCVERYYPEEDNLLTGTLVVNAHLTDKPGNQTIRISRSDRLLYPEYIPESNCIVEVENDEGELVTFTETTPGEYTSDLHADFLHTGFRYRLLIITSNGSNYESEFTELHPSTEIDSVYYLLEFVPTEDPGSTVDGIRFYMDFEIDPDSSAFMRWEIIETYEYHNPDYDVFIYDVDRVVKPVPEELSDRRCWITLHIPEIYTRDVGNINSRQYSFLPLHFVSNETQRLEYGYSILVRQLSMDEAAFRYWDELKKNSQDIGGIYDRQPSFTPSNICNCENPAEKILGFFSVSGVSEKRIFVQNVEGLNIPERFFCLPTFERPRLRFLMNRDLPIFMAEAEWPITGETIFGEVTRRCVDCRIRRGSAGDPPDFWQF